VAIGTAHLYVFTTVLLTVYGQIVIKWQAGKMGGLPESLTGKIICLISLCFNPWVFSSLAAAFLASLSWMVAMTKLDLSHAYPFVSLSFVLVLALSGPILNEPLTLPKILGMALITAGIIVGAQG
jgi:multidrug transporter EmrE-like cation transporter